MIQRTPKRHKFSSYGMYINERTSVAVENFGLPTARVVHTPSTILKSSTFIRVIGFKPHDLKWKEKNVATFRQLQQDAVTRRFSNKATKVTGAISQASTSAKSKNTTLAT
ncbi:conserved hypothetical protein [Ricinus communis]|uniref:Uncharacterized protein n=1 Tax=Ricinus communis TaxID=3988 RepID=B9T269_RICCO|nr:conserved hypothetical protein [Ricinus communis]